MSGLEKGVIRDMAWSSKSDNKKRNPIGISLHVVDMVGKREGIKRMENK